MINDSYSVYKDKTSRSSDKVMYIHRFISDTINRYNIDKIKAYPENVCFKNSNYHKKYDVVVYNDNKPYIIFSVKFICRNYKQK